MTGAARGVSKDTLSATAEAAMSDQRDTIAVQDQVERLAGLFLRQSLGYILTLLDSSGRILSINTQGERTDCWVADQIIGRSHEIFYPPDEITAGMPLADLETATRSEENTSQPKSLLRIS